MYKTAGTLYLETPNLRCLSDKEFQHWVSQVGILQRAFPNSTLRLNNVVGTADEATIHHLLSCTELRGVTVSPTFTPGGRNRQFWQVIAALGRVHGSRLQLQVLEPGATWMLVAEPSLAAHISQAELPWSTHTDAGRSLADHVSSLSNLTKLTLRSVLRDARMLDALRQLSGLQSLHCSAGVLQRLLINSVPSSWPLLTELLLSTYIDVLKAQDWSLVEQQCPKLQALAMHKATPLCLTALTTLTCRSWHPPDRDSFQCSQLARLHVRMGADLNLLPSTLTSLSLSSFPGLPPVMTNLQDQHLSSQQSLVRICFTSQLQDLSDINGLMPAVDPVLTSVTSVELTIHQQAFIPQNMDIGYFRHLGARFPHLQRVHIHLQGRQPEELVLISAGWLPANCRLVVTHKLTCPVRIVDCPSGCLSLPLSSRPADE